MIHISDVHFVSDGTLQGKLVPQDPLLYIKFRPFDHWYFWTDHGKIKEKNFSNRLKKRYEKSKANSPKW
jgi:hypothetical protein